MAEEEFTPEHEIDSQDHEKELERTRDEEAQRAEKALHAEMQKVIKSNKKMIRTMKSYIAKQNIAEAQEALKPQVSKQDGAIVTDSQTGAKAAAKQDGDVAKVLKKADAADKAKTGSQESVAKEAKMGKTAAFCAMLTVGGPYMMQIFQMFRDAMQGKDITQSFVDAADATIIMGLVKQWQNETDAQYWSDFAKYYQAHTAVMSSVPSATPPEPTSADLVLILHYSSVLNPVSLKDAFSWDTAQQRVDAVDALAKTYDPSTLLGKVSFLQSLASIKVGGLPVPRGIQAQLGEMAVSQVIA